MTKKSLFLTLLISTSALASPALAQNEEAPVSRAEVAAMREEMQSLRAELARLSAAAEAPTPPAAAATPAPAAEAVAWRGAPQFTNRESGFSFKPKGQVQFDTGFVSNPNDAVQTQNLGYNSRARRLVIGAEGSLPGGFGYNVEFNLASGSVDYEDVVLTYAVPGAPLQLTLGHFYPHAGLETATSSRLTSFLERDQAVDAFGFNRRIGFAGALTDPDNDAYTFSAGIFNAPIGSAFNNDSWQASVRATYAPKIGETGRLHLGLNYQHREWQSDAQNVRYRARPFTQLTDVRFVDTGAIAARGDDVVGVELAGIFGPFHFASEAHRAWTDGYRPGTTFDGMDSVGGGAFYADDPTFTSAYFEVGYFLTGESRGYRRGRWDRASVKNPVNQGGMGALQINARVDYLDLGDGEDGSTGAPDYVNGGTQTGYQLSAIWNPIDYVRFMLQYSHAAVQGGPLAGTVDPTSASPVTERDYGIDSIALRAQVEF